MLNTVDLDIDDNKVILSTENHEMARILAAALVALFANMGPEHVIVREDNEVSH